MKSNFLLLEPDFNTYLLVRSRLYKNIEIRYTYHFVNFEIAIDKLLKTNFID